MSSGHTCPVREPTGAERPMSKGARWGTAKSPWNRLQLPFHLITVAAMSQTPSAPVRVSCPGCKAEVEVDPSVTGLKCPNCQNEVRFRKCEATGRGYPVMASWTTWTHPGCSIQHTVRPTPIASSTPRVKKARAVTGDVIITVGVVLIGVLLVFVGLHLYNEPPTAMCNGQLMNTDQQCQITGGNNPGTYSYQQMLGMSNSGSLGTLITLEIIGGLLLLIGAWMAYRIVKRIRRTSNRPSTG